MSVLSIRVLQNTQKVVICGRDSPNTQLSSIRPWTITAAYYYIMILYINRPLLEFGILPNVFTISSPLTRMCPQVRDSQVNFDTSFLRHQL